jgi:hypothetical protein
MSLTASPRLGGGTGFAAFRCWLVIWACGLGASVAIKFRRQFPPKLPKLDEGRVTQCV